MKQLDYEAYTYLLGQLLQTMGRDDTYPKFCKLIEVMEQLASQEQKDAIRLALHNAVIAEDAEP